MSNWIETKKEYEVIEQGDLTPKRITLEPEKEKENLWRYKPKEVIDLILRFVGIVAIAVPIILFYKGQQAERDKEKALFQLQIFTDATTEMHALANRKPGSPEFEQIKNKLFYQIYPKLRLLNDKPIVDTFRVMKDIIDFSSIAYILFNNVDSVSEMLRLFNIDRNFIKKESSYYKDIVDRICVARGRVLEMRIYNWTNEIESSKRFTKNYVALLDSQSHEFLEAMLLKCMDANNTYNHMFADSLDTIKWKLTDPENDLLDNITETRYDYDKNVRKQLKPYISKIDSMMIRSSILLYNQ